MQKTLETLLTHINPMRDFDVPRAISQSTQHVQGVPKAVANAVFFGYLGIGLIKSAIRGSVIGAIVGTAGAALTGNDLKQGGFLGAGFGGLADSVYHLSRMPHFRSNYFVSNLPAPTWIGTLLRKSIKNEPPTYY